MTKIKKIHIPLDVEHLKAIKSCAEHMESEVVGEKWKKAYYNLSKSAKILINLMPGTVKEESIYQKYGEC